MQKVNVFTKIGPSLVKTLLVGSFKERLLTVHLFLQYFNIPVLMVVLYTLFFSQCLK